MKISVLQPETAWENKSSNFKTLENLMTPLFNKTDVIILPEMFNTGFSMDSGHLSESAQSETYVWMKENALKCDAGICGSYMVRDKGSIFNRWLFVSPENDSYYYDKRHLFAMGEEDKFFSKGNSRLIFNFRGVRIAPFICYDLRFPVWSRNRNEYDLAIYSANWPEKRGDVWNTLLKARAIENQCYVAGSNRIGTDGNGIIYCGDSMTINPRGEIIDHAAKNTECSITSEISLTELREFRTKFPVFNDADDFTIKS